MKWFSSGRTIWKLRMLLLLSRFHFIGYNVFQYIEHFIWRKRRKKTHLKVSNYITSHWWFTQTFETETHFELKSELTRETLEVAAKMSAQTRTKSIHQWHFITAYRHQILCNINVWMWVKERALDIFKDTANVFLFTSFDRRMHVRRFVCVCNRAKSELFVLTIYERVFWVIWDCWDVQEISIAQDKRHFCVCVLCYCRCSYVCACAHDYQIGHYRFGVCLVFIAITFECICALVVHVADNVDSIDTKTFLSTQRH